MLYPVKKDLPFYTNLKLLQIYRYYPIRNQSKFQFFIILCVWSLMWNGPPIVGPLSLCISSIIKKDYYLATTALPTVLGACVLSATNIFFGVKYKMWSELLKQTTECTKFGKSLKFDKINRNGEMMGKIFYLFLASSIILIATYELFTEKMCRFSRFRRPETCGLMVGYLLPSQLATSTVFKRAVLLYQTIDLVILTVFTAILSLQNQVCEFIEDRVTHLSVMFNKINTAETSKLQYQQFSFCLEYYESILKLCQQLDSTAQGTLGHVTLSTAVVMSLFLYHGIKGNYPMLCYGVIFVLNLVFMCHTGQKLEDAMSQVGDLLYLSKWYDCCIEIQKRVPVVIMRSQRFVGLRALPIGTLNYLLLAAVMKTTYTYVNLMRDTGTN